MIKYILYPTALVSTTDVQLITINRGIVSIRRYSSCFLSKNFMQLEAYAEAIHSNKPDVALNSRPTRRIVLATVVVGNVTVVEPKLAPHVIALGVPLSVIRTSSNCPSVGAPVRLVVIEVIACANPVIEAISARSVSIAGVAVSIIGSSLLGV